MRNEVWGAFGAERGRGRGAAELDVPGGAERREAHLGDGAHRGHVAAAPAPGRRSGGGALSLRSNPRTGGQESIRVKTRVGSPRDREAIPQNEARSIHSTGSPRDREAIPQN